MTPAELQAWRAKSGYSQEELAAFLDLHPMTISKYERGILKIPPLMQWALYGLMADEANGRSIEFLKNSGGND